MVRLTVFCMALWLLGCSSKAPVSGQWEGVNGSTISLEDFRGQWVVVNYWATWCGPCREEMPLLQSFHQTHSDNHKAVVIGVNYQQRQESNEFLFAFLKQYGITFPTVLTNGLLSGATVFGEIKGLPSTYVLNPEGELVAAHAGVITAEQLQQITGLKFESNSSRE